MHSNRLNYSQVCGLQQTVHQVHQEGQNAASPSHVLWLTYCIWHSARPLIAFWPNMTWYFLEAAFSLPHCIWQQWKQILTQTSKNRMENNTLNQQGRSYCSYLDINSEISFITKTFILFHMTDTCTQHKNTFFLASYFWVDNICVALGVWTIQC